MKIEKQDAVALIESFKFLDSKQNVVEDTHGNVSCRVDEGFLIKPSGMTYSSIKEDDIVAIACSNDSWVAVGTRKPSVDTDQHYEIYARNPQVKSICHTHSPYATAFAISNMSMEISCTEHADYFGHKIRCLPYSDLNNWGKIKLEDKEQAVLLGNHGTLICCADENPMGAVKLAVALEAIAKKYNLAHNLSLTLQPMSKIETSKWHMRYNKVYGQ